MAALVRFNNYALRKVAISPFKKNVRSITTSKKNRDASATVAPEACSTTNTKSEVAVEKNWVSYGFDFKSKADDRNAMHGTLFVTVTCCLVFGSFLWSYLPDPQLRDWSQREAFLELRRREKAGLPLIDENYISPDLITLPDEDTLGDTEILI